MRGALKSIGPELRHGLERQGYFVREGLLRDSTWREMRAEAMRLHGLAFEKPGVESCELEAGDFHAAPSLLAYTVDLLATLPAQLDDVSTNVYGTKLAVTMPGAAYPKHVDNACTCDATGLPHDLRWITCIYYLNESPKGGDLRLWLDDPTTSPRGRPLDVAPAADTFVAFYADRLVHEVLPTAADDDHRFALTLWLVSDFRAGYSTHSSTRLCATDRPGARTRRAHFAATTTTPSPPPA
ncbi:hypothetical protein CTAYLR_008848 [Chrysophaeum taylorii]|uniref:Fe2OG dioxygenase domain-containing protein n=1 Tax=Chrysophaeum taylorii TaxID=2483200 RepID=A0AAD7UP97_9STRA|nr:hypothetical protein CTAYLR_008848 [Chrysophaeum taylorii]